ncbi:glycosyltransferase family 4 protein [Arthrobacter sp. LAPM80]|uniref:glycosyltransferase family 4 protein n=1 Tax=Arthrobacter sp. LAPM80 TaxID=3141788 RepID=UPI00398BB7B4
MKILVYPHDMAIGGSQLNAIELAAAVQKLGHDVVVYGQPGPLVERVKDLGLDFISSPAVHRRPTPGVATHLRRTVKELGIDVVHAYEWPPALEAVLACSGRSGAVATATVMSMAVAPFIPANIPMLVGTEQILAAEKDFGRTHAGLLEPPVDTALNGRHGEFHTAAFLDTFDAPADIFTVSIVSRLAHEMKLEGILCAITAIERLNSRYPVQLIIAGDGPAMAEVAQAAQGANAALGATRIFLTGELTDPRPAYACADVSIGMGGSALRAMAFGLPLIVQGEKGFWELLEEESLATFLWQGWYGVGSGSDDAVERLMIILERLAKAPALRAELGQFARTLVCERFSLDVAALKQLAFYEEALEAAPARPLIELRHAGIAAGRFLDYKAKQFTAKLGRRYSLDDFNATPVAANAQVKR